MLILLASRLPPAGDANLTDRFVWGKKIEKEIASG